MRVQRHAHLLGGYAPSGVGFEESLQLRGVLRSECRDLDRNGKQAADTRSPSPRQQQGGWAHLGVKICDRIDSAGLLLVHLPKLEKKVRGGRTQ